MKKPLSFLLFTIALVILGLGVVGGGYLYFYQEAQLESMQIGIAAQNAALKQELLELRNENQQLKNQLAARSPDAASSNSVPTARTNSPVPESAAGVVDMSEMMKNFIMDMPEGESEETDPAKQMMKAIESFTENPAFNKMMVKQEYSGLFKRLGLDPEREEQLMAVLLDNARNSMSGMFGILEEEDGLHDFDKIREKQKDAEKAMREAVAQVLRPDELAVFDDYEANKYEYMQREQMYAELGYLAGQVSDHSLNQFIDLVFLNDTTLDTIDPELLAPDPSMMPTEYFNRRVETLQTALDQLAPQLTPEEHAALARHIELQRMQAAQMETMFENMGMDETFQEMMQGFGVPGVDGN